jgi:hypothetical protein
MQSVIKLTVLNLKADFAAAAPGKPSALPPSVEVIGKQKNSGLTYAMSVLWGARYAGA